MRFLLSTCWLIGAGGGWMLALAGLSAGARGVGPLADLIVFGGASSWLGMLWTALRPGKAPNLWQKILAGASWLMPLGMLLLRSEFDPAFVALSVASAVCVTILVVIYPSQSYVPALEMDRRLEYHIAAKTKPEKTSQEPDKAIQDEGLMASNLPTALTGPERQGVNTTIRNRLSAAPFLEQGEDSGTERAARAHGGASAAHANSGGDAVGSPKSSARVIPERGETRGAPDQETRPGFKPRMMDEEGRDVLVDSFGNKHGPAGAGSGQQEPADEGTVSEAESKWVTPQPKRKGTLR